MTRMVDVLSARSRAKFLEAAVARSQGEIDDEKRLRGEALALQERMQRMQRVGRAREDGKLREGWLRVFAAIERRGRRA